MFPRTPFFCCANIIWRVGSAFPTVGPGFEGSGRDLEGSGRDSEGSGRDLEGSGRDLEGSGRDSEGRVSFGTGSGFHRSWRISFSRIFLYLLNVQQREDVAEGYPRRESFIDLPKE